MSAPPDLIHELEFINRTARPATWHARCGAEGVPLERTTSVPENITCPTCLWPCPRGVEGCDGSECCWICPEDGCQNCHEVFCYICGGGDPRDE